MSVNGGFGSSSSNVSFASLGINAPSAKTSSYANTMLGNPFSSNSASDSVSVSNSVTAGSKSTTNMSQMSGKEIKALVDQQLDLQGIYDKLPEDARAQVDTLAAKQGIQDPAQLIKQPLQEKVAKSPLYQELRNETKSMSAKQVAQKSAEEGLPLEKKIGYQMIADAKANVRKQRSALYTEFMQRMSQPDPEIAELEKKNQELERKINGGGSDSGEQQAAPWGSI